MKKTLVVLAACILTTLGAANAQTTNSAPMGQGRGMGQSRGGNMTPEQRADMQTQRLTKELSLTADQSTQVRAIALAENQEMQTIRGKVASSDSRQGAMREMKTMREKYETQLKAVLTADQLTKYNQMRDERMDNRKDKMKDRGTKQKVKA